ncbi:MAG: DUF547 domain-containing protein [Phycisphaerae bacterium]
MKVRFLTVIIYFCAVLITGLPAQKTDPNLPDNRAESQTAIAEPNEPNCVSLSAGDEFNKEFAPIFSEYVNKDSKVDYRKLSKYGLEMQALLARLAILEPQEYESWTTDEKIAFWINTYNLKMLDIIANNYPVESRRLDRLWWPPNSIRHIPPRGDVGTPKWNSCKFIVMDEEFTLYEIENRFFKNQFKDPRIFLALTMATLDSPPIRPEPYYGKELDKQLEEQTKRFLSSPRAFNIDRNAGKVYLSVLFEPKWPWYGKEFLDKYAIDKKFKDRSPEIRAVLNFISKYVDSASVSYLETGNYKIEFISYDWRVNEQLN